MPNSTRRNRFFTIVSVVKPETTGRCKTCRQPTEAGHIIWSPFHGGGWYHLFCQATPPRPPAVTPPPALRCPVCDQWFRRSTGADSCERCLALSASNLDLTSPSWRRNAARSQRNRADMRARLA